MVEVQTDIKYIKESQKLMTNKMDEFIDSIHRQRESDREEYDKKYASKKVETAFYWVIGIISAIVITAIMSKVII